MKIAPLAYLTAALLSAIHLNAQPAAAPPQKANHQPVPPVKEDFGYDVFEGKTNKIDHIAKVDPQFIWVVYEGGSAGRKIPRSALPPQLKAKFPYDANRSVDFMKDKARENQAQVQLQKQGLRIREQNLEAQIEALKKQRLANEHEIGNLNRQINAAPKSHAARIAKGQKLKLIQEQDDLRKRMENLEGTLKQVQGQMDTLP